MKKKRKKKNSALNSHPGLGSAPDAPNRVNLDAASFAVELFGSKTFNNFLIKSFDIKVAENRIVKWNTILYNQQMYIRVPTVLPSVGCKESFVHLLEVAEEEFGCEQVICCLPKSGSDRSDLIRTFKFMGFEMIPPDSTLLPLVSQSSGKFIFLGCEL